MDMTSNVSMGNLSTGASMLKKSTDMQESLVNKLVGGAQEVQANANKDMAMQQMGIGQNLNKVC